MDKKCLHSVVFDPKFRKPGTAFFIMPGERPVSYTHLGGALLVIYAVQKLRDQQQFRITLSAVWTVLNLIYAGIAFQQGHFTGDVVQIIVFCVPLAVLATFLGSKLQKKISQERFLKLTYVLLLCVGVILLVTS